MKSGLLFDACALIAFLNDEEGAEQVEQIFRDQKSVRGNLFLHEINLLEIYYGVYREEGFSLADETYDRITALPITIIGGLRKKVFKEAGRLKATYKISLADAVAAAIAKTRKIPLVTCDHHEFDVLDRNKELDLYWIR